jgi:hypothetical protein
MAVPQNVANDEKNDPDRGVNRDPMKRMTDRFLVVSYDIPNESQDACPYPSTQPGEQDKLSYRHTGQPSGKRDILPQAGDESANEGADLPMATERLFSTIVRACG